MDEKDFLNREDDKYADQNKFTDSQMEMCSQCGLPRIVTTYEIGFLMLRQQLIALKKELMALSDKIDIVDRRNIQSNVS